MSHSLYFYRVYRITDDLPEIINTGRMSFPHYDVRCSYNSVPLFEIMKAYFSVNGGDCIICHSE